MVIAICLLLAAAMIGYILLVRKQDIPPPPTEDSELKHLEARRQVLYENLKDLQFEYHQGKLSDEDYQSLKQGFLYDLAVVMDSIERRMVALGKTHRPTGKSQHIVESSSGKSAKPRTKAAAASEGPGAVCPSCQDRNPPGNRFCGRCGAPLQAA